MMEFMGDVQLSEFRRPRKDKGQKRGIAGAILGRTTAGRVGRLAGLAAVGYGFMRRRQFKSDQAYKAKMRDPAAQVEEMRARASRLKMNRMKK